MKKSICVILSLVFLICFVSCSTVVPISFGVEIEGTGEISTKEYVDFKSLSVRVNDIHKKAGNTTGGVDIVIINSDVNKVLVTTRESILEHISINEALGTLTISGKPTEKYLTDSIKIEIYGHGISNVDLSCCDGTIDSECLMNTAWVSLSGASKISLSDATKEAITLGVSGASALNIDDISANKVNIIASGASKIEIDNVSAELIKSNISGASNVNVGTIDTKIFDSAISGASDLTIREMNMESLDQTISGGSEVTIAGKCNDISLNLSGSSDFYGDKLESNIADINASGASSAKIFVKSKLSVVATGASSVTYTGRCEIEKQELSGGSTLKKK